MGAQDLVRHADEIQRRSRAAMIGVVVEERSAIGPAQIGVVGRWRDAEKFACGGESRPVVHDGEAGAIRAHGVTSLFSNYEQIRLLTSPVGPDIAGSSRGARCRPRRDRTLTQPAGRRCSLYIWISAFVDASWPSAGESSAVSSAMMRVASTLPSSTPH